MNCKTPYIWIEGVWQRIASFLPCNDVVCSIRRVNRAAAEYYQGPAQMTIHLSQPCPHDDFRHRWAGPGAVRSLTLAQRRQLVCLTAASGRLDNLEVAVAAANCALTGKMLEAAAAAGHVHACQFLRDRGCHWGESLPRAARAGRRDACEWLLAAGCPWSPEAVYEAAHGGHPDLMDWLLLLQPDLKPPMASPRLVAASLLHAAAAGLDLATLQELHGKWVKRPDDGGRPRSHIDRWEWGHILAAAAGSSTPDWRAKVEWLEAQQPEGCGPFPDAVWRAAATVAGQQPPGGDKDDDVLLARLVWLRQRGYPLCFNRCGIHEVLAAGTGNVTVLSYLLAACGGDNAPLFAAVAAEAAAARGLLEVLETLRAAGRLFGGGHGAGFADLARAAARGGQPAVLHWMLQAAAVGPTLPGGGGGGGDNLSSPLDVELLMLAAGCGNVQLMAMLCEGGGGGDRNDDDGRDEDVCRRRDGGRQEGGGGGGGGQQRGPLLLQRLGQQEALEAAVSSGCEAAMDWVADRIGALAGDDPTTCCAGGELCILAARNGDLAALRWLATRLRYLPTEADFVRCVVWGCPLLALRCMAEAACVTAAAAGSSELGCGGTGGGGGWDWEAAARHARSTAARLLEAEEPRRVCVWLDEVVRTHAAAAVGE